MRPLSNVFVFLALTALQSRAAPVWQLTLQSDPGDWIGQGQTYEYDQTTSEISIVHEEDRTHDGITDYIWFQVGTPGVTGWWNLIFGADQIPADLDDGTYLGARQGIPLHPTIDIGGTGTPGTSGRGCNTCWGSFTILTPGFSVTNSSPSFAVVFEQRSESPTAAALHGTFSYNFDSNVPEPSTFLCVGPLALALLLGRRLRSR